MSMRVLVAALVCALSAVQALAEAAPTATWTPLSWPTCDLAPVPDSGPPGTAVALAGTCYPIHSGRPGVFFFDDTPVSRVRGDTPGNYQTGFTVPAQAALGPHEITLRAGVDDGPIVARVAFEVLPFCRGDCDDNGRVTVAEVLVGVNIALGRQVASACPRLDPDHDGAVGIDDLVAAVADLLTGCLVEFTPTPTPRDTPTPVALGGACRGTGDCDDQQRVLCLVPGGFAGCVVCDDAGDECGSDDDCAARGPGLICATRPMLGRDCLCEEATRCVPGCTSDADCDALQLQRCDATSHCADVLCGSDDDCPTHFRCYVPGYGGIPGTCFRRYCGADADCASGYCVEQGCYDSLGTCTLRPGAP